MKTALEAAAALSLALLIVFGFTLAVTLSDPATTREILVEVLEQQESEAGREIAAEVLAKHDTRQAAK